MRLGHQPNYQNYDLQSVLHTKCPGAMVAQSLWETLINDWSNLRPTPKEGVHCQDGQEQEPGWPRDVG